jgi:hypothetical protein
MLASSIFGHPVARAGRIWARDAQRWRAGADLLLRTAG